ncbi:MAG: hypothetical protein MUO53_12090, partial [Maribacter sp.]|nr:hypothetical protein [Maribacter sp.]
VEITDSIVTLKTSSDQLINFPIAQLSQVQRRKLAVGKTIGLSATLLGTTVGIIGLINLATFVNSDWGSFTLQASSND